MSNIIEDIENVKFLVRDLKGDNYSYNQSFINSLENILDYLIENDTYVAKIGNIEIIAKGTILDTAKDKRQVFEIHRNGGEE